MYGSRSRIGLIVPSSNTTNEPEFTSKLPEGISMCTSRMFLKDANAKKLEEMAADAERCAELLMTADVDIVAYGCTTGSLVKGQGYDEEIEARFTEVTGVPTVATAAAVKRAFEALDLQSLAITTPYIDDLNEREVEFFEAAGYEVADMTGLGIESNTEIGEQPSETAFEQAKDLAVSGADGVFISCTNYRTFEIIERLEAELDKPVVTSNQATLWNVLRELGVDDDVGLGSLFEH